MKTPREAVGVHDIQGDSPEETRLLRAVHASAREYLLGHVWCKAILEEWFAGGVAQVFTVHLFRIHSSSPQVPTTLWVLLGDVPPAYLPLDDAPDRRTAVDLYLEELEEWVRRVRRHESVDDLMPVNGAPTLENADALESRIRFLRECRLF